MKKCSFCEGWQYNGREITLPHDAMLEVGRSPSSPGGSATGYCQGGIAVYEKRFPRPEEASVRFLFEGVYRKAKVEINGQAAGGCAYGYSAFSVDAAPYLIDGENTIKVTADNSELPNSRWYSGTGIYRPVWMLTGGETHIVPGSVRVSTIALTPPTIQVEADATGGELRVEIFDGSTLVAAGAPGPINISDAKLWNDETPYLYRCKVTLTECGETADTEEVAFGIRMISKDNNGLYVNGKNVLLRGGCIHHDNGILGACAVAAAEWRKVRMLKEAGFNAIRSAHNPCSAALLDACDHYGVYVIDEAWDMWYQRKNMYDYGLDFEDNWRFDLESMVEKDCNHPSVLMYSIGNEVSEPASEKGLALARELTDTLHHLDHTRLVTGGFNLMLMMRAAEGKIQFSEKAPDTKPMNSSMMFNMMASTIGTGMNKSSGSAKVDTLITPLMEIVDVAGYNYASGRYAKDAKLHPERVIVGSETFPQDIVKNWRMVKQYPALIGDFMWTAWDYLGEAGIGAWAYTEDGCSFNKPYPWLLGDVGAIDLLGNPTGELYLAQAAWGQLAGPVIAVQPVNHHGVQPAKQTWRGTNAIPSWSWKDCDGEKAVVEVYTDAAAVELLLNGKRIGKKKVKECAASFQVHYKPGLLEAVAYGASGAETGRATLRSADAAQPVVQFEQAAARPGEVLFVPVSISDETGIVEANDDRVLTISVENGELLAFGSANPRTEDNYRSGCCISYYGRALAVVRAGAGGALMVTVSDGSSHGSAQIDIENRKGEPQA